MGLPFINDFIKHFKTILQKKQIIQNECLNECSNIDILIVDVSSIVFKYMMGYYLTHIIKNTPILDPQYDDDDIQNQNQVQNQQTYIPIPTIQECITKLYSYAQTFQPNICQIFVFDPIPEKIQHSQTNPEINQTLLQLIPEDDNFKLYPLDLQIDFEKLKQIKSQTWKQRNKSKYIEANNVIKQRMTELYNTLFAKSSGFQYTHIVMSKYESDIMIGSLCERLSNKYSLLTISEDSDMLVHSYPGKVFIPHNGVFDTRAFWELLNIHSKKTLSRIPFHYGCDYQLKSISITSKESFKFISDLQTLNTENLNSESMDSQAKLIQQTFLYEPFIENDYQWQSLPLKTE